MPMAGASVYQTTRTCTHPHTPNITTLQIPHTQQIPRTVRTMHTHNKRTHHIAHSTHTTTTYTTIPSTTHAIHTYTPHGSKHRKLSPTTFIYAQILQIREDKRKPTKLPMCPCLHNQNLLRTLRQAGPKTVSFAILQTLSYMSLLFPHRHF